MSEFEEGVALLLNPRVKPATVLELAGTDNMWIACIAHEAAARREDMPTGLTQMAVSWLAHAGPLELCFLLRFLGTRAHRPVVSEALAQCDEDWLTPSVVRHAAAFVRARIEAGEEPDPDLLGRGLEPEDEPVMTALVAELGDELPPEWFALFDPWRRSTLDWTFFMTFGREVQPEERALLLTEPRAAAVEAIVDAVADRRSVVLVGERGSGIDLMGP